MRKFGRFLTAFIIAFAVYAALTSPFRHGPDLEEIAAGALIALFAGLAVMRDFPLGWKYFNPLRWARFLVYLPVFVWKMILANLQIAAVVVDPRLPVRPSLIRYRTGLKSGEGKLALTSSVTLTPGTLTVDVRDQDIYIHCVKEEKDPVSPFEKLLKGVTE